MGGKNVSVLYCIIKAGRPDLEKEAVIGYFIYPLGQRGKRETLARVVQKRGRG
jgi:hypothetical protein